MASSVIRAKGQVTIPMEIRRAAGLNEGDHVEVEMTEDGILLRPKRLIDAGQAWFWTQDWQEGEREASADVASGRITRYETAEAFLAGLERPRRAAGRPGRARRGKR